MSDDADRHDPSMSEILASIRRIVSDEEKSRRGGGDPPAPASVPAVAPAALAKGGGEVLDLTGSMRVGDGAAPAAPAVEAPKRKGFWSRARDAETEAEDAEGALDLDVGPAAPVGPASGADFSDAEDVGDDDAIGALQPAAATGPVDFSEPPMDEEQIADLVRDIIREELQGPIGQQISRKVKRLIREEVAKALGEREAD